MPTSSGFDANQKALADAVPSLYSELRRLAASYLRRERGDHTLQTTALVHEAYLRMIGQKQVHWDNRNQFMGIAAQLMRRVLVDHSRAHQAAKRGGRAERVFIEETAVIAQNNAADVIAVDEALTRLAAFDPSCAQLVELRFFAGLTNEEAAQALGVSAATAKRTWNVAKSWLARELREKSEIRE